MISRDDELEFLLHAALKLNNIQRMVQYNNVIFLNMMNTTFI